MGRLTLLACLVVLALLVGSCARPRPAAVPPPTAPAAVPPVLAPQLGRQPDERLRQEAEARIDGAERSMNRIDRRRLAEDQHETLVTIQDFLVKARQAVLAKDFSRAFNLADKAKVLADDLARATR